MHSSSMLQTTLSTLPTVKSAIGGPRLNSVNISEEEAATGASLGDSYVEIFLVLLTVCLSILSASCCRRWRCSVHSVQAHSIQHWQAHTPQTTAYIVLESNAEFRKWFVVRTHTSYWAAYVRPLRL